VRANISGAVEITIERIQDGGGAYDGAREVVHRHARGKAKAGSEKGNETIWNRQREGEIPMGGIGRRKKMRHFYRMRHAEEADGAGLRDLQTEIERKSIARCVGLARSTTSNTNGGTRTQESDGTTERDVERRGSGNCETS